MASICRRVIAVEGPDGAGKSTVAKALSEFYGWPVVHTGGPIVTREDFYQRMKDLDLLHREEVIFDRIPFISDRVYTDVLRPRPQIFTWAENLAFLEEMQPAIVYCRLFSSEAMVRKVLDTAKAHKPLEYLEKVKQQHPLITKAYDRIMNDLPAAWQFRYNWERRAFENLIEALDWRMGYVRPHSNS